MMARPFVVCVAFILACLWAGPLAAFEIQYPGEDGFFIGRPMVYMITADSKGQNVGKEGIFTFGRDLITIGGTEYYDSVFESPTGDSHFYFLLDSVKADLMQKGFKIGSSELMVDPTVTAVNYPLASGDSWSEKTDLTAKDLEIPGLGRLPIPVSAKGVNVETQVSSNTISVPAGTFNTLLVKATFTGSILGIPIILIQRTWLSEDNVAVKRNFEFLKPTPLILYEIELSSFTTTPWDVNWDAVVDILDVVTVARHFGERIVKPMMQNPDVDGNGIVDILDLVKVGVHFGKGYNSAAPAE